MDVVLQYRRRPFDANIWHKDAKDEDWKRHRKLPRQASARKGTVGTLVRAARAITERENLSEYADALTDYLEVSREQLYSMPLAEFIERYESAQLTEEINAAYDKELEQEDEEFLAHVKSYQGRVLDAED